MRAEWLLLISLTGCISQAEFDKVSAERDALTAQVGQLEGRVSGLEKERERLIREADKARGESEARRKAAAALAVAKAREALGLAEGQKLAAIVHTNKGDIRCELWPDVAPLTVSNFVGLAEGTREWKDPRTGETRKTPLYDGTVFHRVIRGFMIQGGDPLGTGRGGPGYRFEDEVHPDVRFDQPGLLAMANAGPGTNGSQFFITDSQPAHLNGKHTIFGACELPVVRDIVSVPTAAGDRPVDPVVISNIEIERG